MNLSTLQLSPSNHPLQQLPSPHPEIFNYHPQHETKGTHPTDAPNSPLSQITFPLQSSVPNFQFLPSDINRTVVLFSAQWYKSGTTMDSLLCSKVFRVIEVRAPAGEAD
ncbi:hypothetical protein TNCT_135551 [Trichonephila clavata]|uniref:Uncharacterized protein n=1 Tax=Trichonephila clavata TaxID=2740835 RepID=A0A8X6KFU5_TRICU|nr:hypothetical protein TNCT_135551 [Trichonephila clavata]